MKAPLFLLGLVLCLIGCDGGSGAIAPRFDDLPENVQAKIRLETEPGRITRIEKEQDGKRAIYHVSFRQQGELVKVSVTEHGMIISDSRNRVIHEPAGAPLAFGTVAARSTFNTLPPEVQKAIGTRTSSKLEIVKVRKTERSGVTLYEIEFAASGKNPRLYVSEDGAVIEDQRDAFRQ